MSAMRELPRYKCHKEVWALKIDAIEIHQDGSATIATDDDGYAPFRTKPGFKERFKGNDEERGYYVLYKGGYESWSPAKDFEEGYSRL